jgi:hypothetical protein
VQRGLLGAAARKIPTPLPKASSLASPQGPAFARGQSGAASLFQTAATQSIRVRLAGTPAQLKYTPRHGPVVEPASPAQAKGREVATFAEACPPTCILRYLHSHTTSSTTTTTTNAACSPLLSVVVPIPLPLPSPPTLSCNTTPSYLLFPVLHPLSPRPPSSRVSRAFSFGFISVSSCRSPCHNILHATTATFDSAHSFRPSAFPLRDL